MERKGRVADWFGVEHLKFVTWYVDAGKKLTYCCLSGSKSVHQDQTSSNI